MNFIGGYADFVSGVRIVLLYAGILVALICAIDWAVRTRRINPFSRVARFFRGSIDPLLAPIERVIVRAGGLPSSAAWWALVAYAVFGILVITLLQFIGQLLFQFAVMLNAPSEAWRILLGWVLSLLSLALFVRVLSSWFPVSPYSRWIRWSFVLTDWMIRPLQRVVPRVGMFDITPIVAWLLLRLAGSAILG
jgi:YggT family protein